MTKENNRHLEVRIQETRMVSNGDMMVSGYVNMTDTLSYELGYVDKFVEKIAPGTFTRAINRAQENGQDIDFLAEHNDTIVLASTKNGTLSLREDETGLFMEARIINTSSGRDYHEMIKSGIITNMSFGFYAVEDDWRSVRSDLFERTVTELELFEVSAVRRPAYAASSISGRGLNLSDESVPENIKEERDMNTENENILLDAILELSKEVRELKEEKESRADDKKKEKDAKDAEKKQEDKEGKPEYSKDEKEADVEKTEAKKDGEPKPDADAKNAEGDKDKESTSEKDSDEEVEKARKKKEEEDKKKRSYSLLREEFKNLRGGNE